MNSPFNLTLRTILTSVRCNPVDTASKDITFFRKNVDKGTDEYVILTVVREILKKNRPEAELLIRKLILKYDRIESEIAEQ